MTTATPRPPAIGEERRGARAHTISLLTLFLGVPAALVVGSIYSLAVGTADFGGDPDVTGWRGVFYDLPSSVLVVGVTIVSVVYAAKALQARAYGAKVGLWLSVIGLFLIVMMVGMGAVNAVVKPYSPALHWAVRLFAAATAAVAMVLARRSARPSPS
jgi:hypothetical protein